MYTFRISSRLVVQFMPRIFYSVVVAVSIALVAVTVAGSTYFPIFSPSFGLERRVQMLSCFCRPKPLLDE